MKRKMPKVLLALTLMCVLALGAAVAAFAGSSVTEDYDYGDGLVIDGSTGWNTSDGDNYLVTYEGTVVRFANDPFVRDTDNWSNFIIETVSSTEADGITLRADAYGWTYGDGVNTPWYDVNYNWDWEDFYAICTENMDVTLTAVQYDGYEVDFIIEFGNSGYELVYYVYYDEGVPSELWFHVGADGGIVYVTSVEYVEINDITAIGVDSVAVDEYFCDSRLDLSEIEITVYYEDGTTEALSVEDGYAYDAVGNEFECYLLLDLEEFEWSEAHWQGSYLYNEGTGRLIFTVYDVYGRYLYEIETNAEITVRSLELTDVLEANPTELELNVTYQTSLEEEGDWVWYSFTPEASGYYVFRSSNNYQKDYVDPYVELYVSYDGENLYYCDSDDDDASGANFSLKYYMEAGYTYYYKARSYDDSFVGVYDVVLTEGKDIAAIYVGDLTQTEVIQYVETFDLSGTVITIVYADETTAEIEVDGYCAVDEYGNIIYYYVEYEGWRYSYDTLGIPAGDYTVTFITDDYASDDVTKSITVTAIEDSEYICVIELLNTVYTVEVADGTGEVWYCFTPSKDGQYYFAYTVASEAYYLDWWCYAPQYYYEEDGYIYYNWVYYAYDENGDWVYVEDGDYTWCAYELTAGVTYYIPAYYYGYTEDWECDDSTAAMTMLVGQVSHTHTYDDGVITFTWSDDYSTATAELRCDSCSETLTGTATVTSVTTEATATEAGSIVYTAVVTINGVEYTDTVTVVIPATGETETETGNESGDETESTTDTSSTSTSTSTDADDTDSNNGTGGAATKTSDVSTLGYYVILFGAAAVIAVLVKKRVNA